MKRMKRIVTLGEMKQYLRVDYDEEDQLISGLIESSVKTCMEIIRTEDAGVLASANNAKIAVMYMAAYLYEHREEADHNGMMLTIRSLLSGSRKEEF